MFWDQVTLKSFGATTRIYTHPSIDLTGIIILCRWWALRRGYTFGNSQKIYDHKNLLGTEC